MRRCKVGLISAKRFPAVSFLKSLLEHSDVSSVHVLKEDYIRVSKYVERGLGKVSVHEELESLFDEVNSLVVVSTDRKDRACALQALERNIPVLIDGPIADDMNGLKKAIGSADNLYAVNVLLYDECFRELVSLARKDTLGEVLSVSVTSRLKVYDRKSVLDSLYSFLYVLIDLLSKTVEEPIENTVVAAEASDAGIFTLFETSNKRLVSIDVHYCRDRNEIRGIVLGTSGAVVLKWPKRDILVYSTQYTGRIYYGEEFSMIVLDKFLRGLLEEARIDSERLEYLHEILFGLRKVTKGK
ncbi:MAG: hypothetical protein DRJ52_00720 [Thermoprotei archaeon]|nr:MAG: hypothetical protein DRJ52_00720 [Thermoprotei archaeon]RLF00416.1 MAG: hypothetical protein DRJ63_02435 [Thermoprotei archaeon]